MQGWPSWRRKSKDVEKRKEAAEMADRRASSTLSTLAGMKQWAATAETATATGVAFESRA